MHLTLSFGQATSPAPQSGNITRPLPFCGTDAATDFLLKKNPSTDAVRRQVEQLMYRQLQKRAANRSARTRGEISIPVVVHIVHNGGAENISDEQVRAGIAHLNEAFSNTGAYDSLTGVRVGITFCLARQDPQGKATNGITRSQSFLTEVVAETQDGLLKNLVRWDPRFYVNIWLVKEIYSLAAGAGTAGYALLPYSHGRPEDGIVNEARYFGSSTDNSKVHVHEMGHYLGLYHTFQGSCRNDDCLQDGDKVCDTPPDASVVPVACGTSINTCTTDARDGSGQNPFRPFASGGKGDQPDMTINYMDYSYQACQSAFTEGQRQRMLAAISAVRSSLLESPACQDPCPNPVIAQIGPVAAEVALGSTLTLPNATTGATRYSWQVNGVAISEEKSPEYTFSREGVQVLKLIAANADLNCRGEDFVTIRVVCPLQTTFSASNRNVSPGGTVTFASTTAGAGSYQWLVDGKPSGTEASLRYTFPRMGGYQVALVTGNGACVDTSASVFVRVGSCSTGKEANVWILGNSNGIDFNGGTPTLLPPNTAKMDTEAGLASIADGDGNLLFYTNGAGVWNRNHEQMPNGNGLTGNRYATQSSLIVPQPGSATRYYLFTVQGQPLLGGISRKGLQYSEVDMALEGGLGDIITSTKNTPLHESNAEKLIAIKHCNGVDTWIVVHDWTDNKLLAYLITPSGVTPTPVASVAGEGLGMSENDVIGQMKASPDGKSVALAMAGSGIITVLRFDNATGLFANPVSIYSYEYPNPYYGCYGVEFSPDGSKLYVASAAMGSANPEDIGRIFQFDLKSHEQESILASAVLLNVPEFARYFGSLQLGPDGKIYVVRLSQPYLGVIQNPNAVGAACQYKEEGVDLKELYYWYGLPNFISNYLVPAIPDIAGPGQVCANSGSVRYSVKRTACDAATYGWRVQGKAAIASSDDTSVTLRFEGSGTDTLIVDKTALCGTTSDTLLIRVAPPAVVDLGNDTTLCGGAALALDAGSTWSSTWWSNGATTRTIAVTTAGTYWVEVSNPGGCKGRDTIQVREPASNLSVDLGKDTTVCQGRAVVLDAGAGYGSYRWQDGSRERIFTAFGPGRYWVTVSDACGTRTATDTLAVSYNSPQKIDLGSDRAICAGQQIRLDAGPGFAHYLWPDGSSEQTFTLREPGRYWVAGATQSGCFSTDTIAVHAAADPFSLDLGPDTTICREETLILNAGIPDGDTYFWNDASTAPTLTVSEAGTYWVEVRRGNCTTRDSITVAWGDCVQKVWIPNVITPNGDGKNDTFAFEGTGNGPVQMTITNRHGRTVYANRHYAQDWSGEEVANGVYYYQVVDTASGKVYRGWVQVLR